MAKLQQLRRRHSDRDLEWHHHGRVRGYDPKVRIEATGLTTFPDVSVVCGDRETAEIDPNAVVNPTLLVEVTSPSTEDYDRGEKLSHYKQIESLQAVLLVSHRRKQVTVYQRSDDGWEQRDVRAGEIAVLSSPELSISVDELYAGIQL